MATHKPNVYIDLSGWSPKYFPPILVRYINSILQDKMLFGSDWPVITPDRWLSDFAKLEIREEIRPKVLKANARRAAGHLGLMRALPPLSRPSQTAGTIRPRPTPHLQREQATPVACCAVRFRRGVAQSPSGLHAFVAGGFSVGIARRFHAVQVLAIALLVRATFHCEKGPLLRVLDTEAP